MVKRKKDFDVTVRLRTYEDYLGTAEGYITPRVALAVPEEWKVKSAEVTRGPVKPGLVEYGGVPPARWLGDLDVPGDYVWSSFTTAESYPAAEYLDTRFDVTFRVKAGKEPGNARLFVTCWADEFAGEPAPGKRARGFWVQVIK